MNEMFNVHEACGVFGCVAAEPWPAKIDVAQVIISGLVCLQHRGQESAGIVTSDGNKELHTHKGMGLVSQVFHSQHVIKGLVGYLGIGHNRYSTAGVSEIRNCQPFVVETLHGRIAVAHNGQLINADKIRKMLLECGTGLSTCSDSELIIQLLSRPPKIVSSHMEDWIERLKYLMHVSPLSYSLLILKGDKIYALRDVFGNRPLCIGQLLAPSASTQMGQDRERVQGWIISSESCSFQSLGAKYMREVLPGEIVCVSREGVKTVALVKRPSNVPPAFCIFEYVYFSRPDSLLQDRMVYAVREQCGRQLAIESPVTADIVSTVPESATPAALGYSQQSGIPYAAVLCKNSYVGRTFIQPSTALRQSGVSLKFGVITSNVVGKRIILVDDSIVRGNTIAPIVALLRKAGAAEVHIRIASPPIKHPCYMGISIPTKEELIANRLDISEIARHFGADSVVYLSLDGLIASIKEPGKNKTNPNDNIEDRKNDGMNGATSPPIYNNDTAEENGNDFIGSREIIGHCTACLSGSYPCDDW